MIARNKQLKADVESLESKVSEQSNMADEIRQELESQTAQAIVAAQLRVDLQKASDQKVHSPIIV